jgi:hypothetical protein
MPSQKTVPSTAETTSQGSDPLAELAANIAEDEERALENARQNIANAVAEAGLDHDLAAAKPDSGLSSEHPPVTPVDPVAKARAELEAMKKARAEDKKTKREL